MKHLLLVALLLFAALPAHAQDRWTTTFYVSAAAADEVTTYRNMRRGYWESDPLYRFTQQQPTGTLLSLVATDVVTLWIAHHYAARHPKLVRFTLLSLGGIRAYQAVHNVVTYEPIPFLLPQH